MAEELKNSPFHCIFLRTNNEEIREKIKNAGFSVCACAEFDHASWLVSHPNTSMCFDIHGEGYWDYDDIISMRSEEAQHNFFLYQLKEHNRPYVDCGKDVDLFIKLLKEAKENAKKETEKDSQEKASNVDNEYFGRYINEHHNQAINNIMADLAERFINGEEVTYNTSFGKIKILLNKM